MTVRSETLHLASDIILDGEPYELADNQYTVELVPTQPGDGEEPWEKRIDNWALGWGSSRYEQPGTYDYGAPATLHRRGVFLPGAAVTALSPGTAPTGNVSFGEYWDGTDANRRLIIVSARHVYEVNSAGTISTNTMTALVPSTARMGKPTRFRTPGMAAPKVFIPVQNGGATDYFIVRIAANTYIENAGNKIARAFAAGKDIDGQDVLYRVDEDGELNLTTTGSDPNLGASWAGATYGAGETSSRVNDLYQQHRAILAGKEDGVWTFDSRLNAVPVTPGIGQTPDVDNFTYFKDANGMAVAPSAQGIVWIDGLDWGVCGPVSANPGAENLRGPEPAVSAVAGNYIYSAVYDGADSYIFLGTPRLQGDIGEGPFTWHGPVAVVSGYQVKDLHVSTVFGTKLWWGAVAKFGYISLKSADFSPETDSASGHIYLPEGILDIDGPGVIKDFNKVEFVTRAARPFSSTNAWTFSLETTPASGTYVAVGSVTGSSDGVLASRFWTTETSGKRFRSRITYSGNTGNAELEAVVVRGTQRPETTSIYTMVLRAEEGMRNRRGARDYRKPASIRDTLTAMVNSGRKTALLIGDSSVTVRVTSVREKVASVGEKQTPGRELEVRMRRVVTS
jgi:hypothetical protein